MSDVLETTENAVSEPTGNDQVETQPVSNETNIAKENQETKADWDSADILGDLSPEQTSEEPSKDSDNDITQDSDDGDKVGSKNDLEGKETEQKTTDQKEVEIEVDGKKYNLQDAQAALEKTRRHQGERDKAESTLQKFVSQAVNNGFDVDENFNLVKKQQESNKVDVKKAKKELIQNALAGDEEAMEKLLEINSLETAGMIENNWDRKAKQTKLLEKTISDYPGMFKEDGSFDESSDLYKTGIEVVKENPQLYSKENIPLIAEMAEARLLKKNLPRIEQDIKNKSMEKQKQTNSLAVGTPNSGVSTEQANPEISKEQASWGMKFGVSPDRLSKVVARAKKENGMYI